MASSSFYVPLETITNNVDEWEINEGNTKNSETQTEDNIYESAGDLKRTIKLLRLQLQRLQIYVN